MPRAHLLVPALSLLALAAATQAKPDFSGSWTLSRERSTLQAPFSSIERGTVRIAHREPEFSFHRAFVTAGREDTLGYELKTDGSEVERQEGAIRSVSSLRWVGDTLMYLSRMTAPFGTAVDTVFYRLLNGGRVLQADERFRGARVSYTNLWIFEKS